MTPRVLLIEDEPNIAEAISFILSRDGCDVMQFPDGVGAFEQIRTAMPDLVILDLMLPGRSGMEILLDLRADPATCDVPVMMLTAKGQGRDREAAERAGATRFMTKPFVNDDMRAAVRALTTGRTPSSPTP